MLLDCGDFIHNPWHPLLPLLRYWADPVVEAASSAGVLRLAKLLAYQHRDPFHHHPSHDVCQCQCHWQCYHRDYFFEERRMCLFNTGSHRGIMLGLQPDSEGVKSLA